MQKHGKKLCAFLLALCMIIGLVPVTASAALLDGEDYITQQLYLGEDLVLHLRGNIPEEYADGSTATITYAGKTDSYTINDLTPDENGLYDLSVELAVAQMTEEINLVLKAKLGLIPIEAINETYSVREYLKTLIDGNYTRETKQLSQELLNYGAWAQKYFNYKTDNLANRGYDIEVQNPVPSELPALEVTGKVEGIRYYGATVLFQSKTGVRYYFSAPNGVQGYTVTVDGKKYELVQKGSLYYVEVPGINAKDMATPMTVAVTDGTDTLSFGYAPTWYFIRNYHKTTDENLKGLMEAAYSYFMAAQEFAGVTDTGKLTFEYKNGTANSIQVNTNLPADIALADFKLTDNGCSVNEDANTKKARNVSMSNVDGKIVLTFNFAESFTAGETYSLPKNAFFCFTDNSQYALDRDYIFQFNGTAWTQVEVTGDFLAGVNFEQIGNTLLFTGEGPSSKAATVQRVAHNTEIPALSGGGDYALKLSHASSYYPTFRINFGKELAAGTKFSFMAFGIIFGDSQYNHSVFEFNNGGDATVQFTSLEWTQLTMTLPEAADHVDLFWNFERAGLTDENTIGAVYVDNFVAIEPVEAEGDFTQGVNFETAGNAALFEGQGIADRDAVIVRVPYANTEISAPENGGNYALKLSHPSNYWPTFRINFGKELAAGTTISFMAYGKINGETVNNKSIFEFMHSGDATAEFACGAWTQLTMTLPEAADHIDLFWNYDRATITSTTASGEVYIDNIIAVEPVEISGDILEGLDFEDAGNALWFGGVGGDQAWRDATLERVSFDGDYALRITCASSQWPVFRINFGKTLKAGTVISFQAYSRDISDPERNTVSIFENLPGESYLVSTSSNGATDQYYYNSWNDLTIVLAEDREYVDLVCNMDRWNEPGPANLEVYVDNFKAVEPADPAEPVGDFTEGVGFETEGNELWFGAVGGENAWRDATLEKIAYADAGITVPANGGEYALKITCASSQWPVFRISFGKTLKAGTVISFQAYSRDISDPERNTVSIFENLPGESYLVSTSSNGATDQYYYNSWNDLTIVLAEDREYVDLMCNMDRWNELGPANLEVYVDNFKAVEPAESVEPTGDILEGLDFETAGNEMRFTGIGGTQAATIERVSYADMGIAGPNNGGEYALKLSHTTEGWPHFRINFGKTLPAGTTITFNAYGYYDGDVTEWGRYMKVELTADAKNYAQSSDPNQVAWMSIQNWVTSNTITLTADCDYLDLQYNVADGAANHVLSWLLLDNIKAVEPDMTLKKGLTFESESDNKYLSGQSVWNDATIERVSYADAGITAAPNGGSYAMKLTHDSSQWPAFRINLGRTMPAGTVIIYDAYSTCASLSDANSAKSLVVWKNAEGVEIEMQSHFGQWTTLKMTLDTDTDVINLYWNMDQFDIDYPITEYALYLDNIKAVEPISETISFEYAADTGYFTGIGRDWSEATFERVAYADLGIGAPADGGEYALKMSHTNDQYPTFRINFGKTVKAGTKLKMDIFGSYDYDGANQTGCVVLCFNDPWAQAVYMGINTWYEDCTLEAELSADCTYVDFYWETRLGVDVPSYIVVDNIEIIEAE